MRHARGSDRRFAANEAGPPLSPLIAAPRPLVGGWRYLLPALLVFYLCVALIHAYRAPMHATGYQDAPACKFSRCHWLSSIRSPRR